ncbi:hypothetical protein V7S43_008599 [Phytophthora oleae]|uniref:Uncharacterized protein n=1 Tax=Phytophthora oleae TaxID=2107226 RepID=A0ABD3FHE3_9STRA
MVSFFAHLKSREGLVEFKDMGKKLRRPKVSDWLTINCLSTLLDPFSAATEAPSGQQYPTMPLVLPILHSIRKHLSRTDMFAAHVAMTDDELYVKETEFMMDECRKTMLTLFDERFSALGNSELVWVAYLDPRVGKRMTHLGAAGKQSAADALINAACDLAKETMESEGDDAHRFASQSTPQFSERASHFMADVFGLDELPQQHTDLRKTCARSSTAIQHGERCGLTHAIGHSSINIGAAST